MEGNKIILRSMIAAPKSETLYDLENNLKKLSYITKESYSFIEEFREKYYKEIVKIALEHSLSNVFEQGFSINEVDRAIWYFQKNNIEITKAEQEKLLNDCDEIADWVRTNIPTTYEIENLTHDTYHKLSYLYLSIKRIKTKD